MRISMKATMLLAAVLMLLATAVQAAPTITAATNPVEVPAEQTQGNTVITWDAETNTDAEVWLKVDNKDETRFSGDSKGAQPATIKVGSKYTFNLYSGKPFILLFRDPRSKVIASVEVSALNVRERTPPPLPAGDGTTLDDLALRGAVLASKDPLATELRNRELNDSGRRGFDIGMAAAEGHTLVGPGKQKAHDSLPAAERSGFSTAVAFSVERNSNAGNAAKGAAIARAIPLIAKARTVDKDVFYWLGFDIATGIFGDPALGAQGNTAVGPGSLKIRDSLSAGGQRGFNAAVKMYLGQDITPPPGKLDPNSPFEKIATKENNSTGELLTQILKEPFISVVQVVPGAQNVIISFASTQSTPPLIEIGKAAPKLDPSGKHLVFAPDSGAFSRFAQVKKGRYVLDVDVQGEQLDISTTYYYLINVFNNDRNDTKRPREQIAGEFTTLPQSVKVVWHSIVLEDDSDNGSTGEIAWWFWVNYGQPSQKRAADYYNGDMDSGHHYYPDKTVIIENAPDHLSLSFSGWDDDSQFGSPAEKTPKNEPPMSGPKNQTIGDGNVANGEFDLSKYPGTNVTVPFSLGSMPHGDLRFVIHGRIEITRPTP